VAKGNPFIMANAGKPMVKVLSLSAEEGGAGDRRGFMAGEISTPDSRKSFPTRSASF
jgi:hypothetical protein